MLADYQDRLAAQDTFGLLLVLQGIDAAGKDGTIKHVMSGVNPRSRIPIRSSGIRWHRSGRSWRPRCDVLGRLGGRGASRGRRGCPERSWARFRDCSRNRVPC